MILGRYHDISIFQMREKVNDQDNQRSFDWIYQVSNFDAKL